VDFFLQVIILFWQQFYALFLPLSIVFWVYMVLGNVLGFWRLLDFLAIFACHRFYFAWWGVLSDPFFWPFSIVSRPLVLLGQTRFQMIKLCLKLDLMLVNFHLLNSVIWRYLFWMSLRFSLEGIFIDIPNAIEPGVLFLKNVKTLVSHIITWLN